MQALNQASGQPPHAPGDMTVLVVEDDAFHRDVAHEMLLQLGVGHVHLAQDGSQGLKQLRRLGKVDAVLLDLYMPDVDGVEFISGLSHLNYGGKVILVSGASLEMLQLARQLAQENGINVVATIEKPLYREDIARAFGGH